MAKLIPFAVPSRVWLIEGAWYLLGLNIGLAHLYHYGISHIYIKAWRIIRSTLPLPSTMAHTVMYPGKNFLYAIGNTSAVVLTDTLSPEEPANLLLLGCGDPRNILFTVYNQPDISECQ